jgi:hypothetical protein
MNELKKIHEVFLALRLKTLIQIFRPARLYETEPQGWVGVRICLPETR